MDAVPRATRPVPLWVSPLDDEARDVAMERKPVVEALPGELAEVRDVDGCAITVKTNADDALARIKDSDLITRDLVRGGVQRISEEAHAASMKSNYATACAAQSTITIS